MKVTTIKTKENIFGVNGRTPGQNLMRAVTGSDQPIGIPHYNYDQMMGIMNKALGAKEVDLLCRGYGFNCERQSQKEIATDLNVDTAEISLRAHRAVEKLQASPFKTQLRALVPTLEELFASIINLRNENESLKSSGVSQKAVERLKALLEQTEIARKDCETENARLSYEIEAANKKLEAITSQLTESQARVAGLTSQVVREKARAEAVKKAFDETLEEAKVKFAARAARAEVTVGTLEGLHLSKEALNRLQRAGVRNIEMLCSMTTRSLSKLGVGRDILEEVKQRLSENGLSLRAG